MTRTITRWSLLLGALLVVGPLLGAAQSALIVSGDGGPAATALVSRSVVIGVVLTLVIFGMAGAYGAVTGRVCGVRSGMIATGFVLLGPAWVSGTMVDLLRWADAPGALLRLAFEGVLVGTLGGACALLIARTGKHDEHDHSDGAMSAQGVLGLSVAIAAGAAGAWLVARESLKGQTVAAGIVAGVAAGLLGRVIAHRTPALTFVIGAGVMAVVAPLMAAVVHGDGALRDVYEQTFVAIGLLTPMEWIAGAFVGAPLGMTWAASMVDRK